MGHRLRLRALVLGSAAALAAGCSSAPEGAVATHRGDIVGGVEANGAALDAIGTLGAPKEDGTFGYTCSATLIAPSLVLTAKHCAMSGSDRDIDFMPVYFAVGPDSTKPRRTVRAKDVLIAPIAEGGFGNHGSDVAIYVLAEPITEVTPFRMADATIARDRVGEVFTAFGYGMRSESGGSGLRRAGAVTLRAVDGKPMQAMFESKDAYLAHVRKVESAAFIVDRQESLDELWDFTLLSSYEAWLGVGKDDAQPCSGDSGGPLIHKTDDGQLAVAGVVSASPKGQKHFCGPLGESFATFGPAVQEMLHEAEELLRDRDPCKGVSVEGSCDGTVAVRCVSEEEGLPKVTRLDCGLLNQTCAVDAVTKRAGCADAAPGGG